MRMAQKFAGFSLAEADSLRKAMGKKIRAAMEKEREKFMAGIANNGYEESLGKEMFDTIAKFADYAFNKSHSYGYGYVAFQIAYLKANYPVEYLAALLTSVKGSLDKAAVYLNECRLMEIEVLVPDVNRSAIDFTAILPDAADASDKLGEIPFGLSAVRNVGGALVAILVEEREANGPFTDFYEFCERVDTQVLHKRTIESLIKAGGFDSLGHPRQGLLSVFEQIIDQVIARRREHDMGVMTLFGDAGDGADVFDETIVIPDMEFEKKHKLAFEKEMLGLYISDHPLKGLERQLARKCDARILDIAELEDGDFKMVGGVVTALQRKWTKKGDLMAVFELEDLGGSMEAMVFPRTMSEINHLLNDDAIVVCKVRVDKRDDLPKLIIMELDLFDAQVSDTADPVNIQLPERGLPDGKFTALRDLLAEYPGKSEVFIYLGEAQYKLPGDMRVDSRSGLVGELRVLLGPDAIRL